MIISCRILLIMRNVPDKFVEKIKTHILFSVTFYRKSCRLWDNVEKKKYCRAAHATDDNMEHAHCMPHNWCYKHILIICNTYCFSTATMVTRTRLNVTIRKLLVLCFLVWNKYNFCDLVHKTLVQFCRFTKNVIVVSCFQGRLNTTHTHYYVCRQHTNTPQWTGQYIRSFSILSDDRFKASSKTIPPHSAI